MGTSAKHELGLPTGGAIMDGSWGYICIGSKTEFPLPPPFCIINPNYP